MVFKYYEVLVATIETADWSTDCFRYEIGVFQGCVLSPILFDIVFNLLLDLLSQVDEDKKSRYMLKSCGKGIHDLAYADDLTLVTRTVERQQKSLDMVDKFLEWTRTMAAKPRKCKCLGLKKWRQKFDEEMGRKRLTDKCYGAFDPNITLDGQSIGFIEFDFFKFLGWKVYHDLKESQHKEILEEKFDKLMNQIDKADVHGFMKLWLYQHYVLAYLSWEMMVYDFDVSWIKSLESKATALLKAWAGIYKKSIVSLLYRPRSTLGLGITCMSDRYQRQQINKVFVLQNSKDETVRTIFDGMSKKQKTFTRRWKPIPLLEDLENQVDFETEFAGQVDRQGLGHAKNRYIRNLTTKQNREKVAEKLSQRLSYDFVVKDLNKCLQGAWTRLEDVHPFDFSWSNLINTRNPKLISWVLNASTDCLTTPAVLTIWGLSNSDRCDICEKQGSLSHILSCCQTALKQGRYDWRHDSVLKTLEIPIRKRLEKHNTSPFKKVDRTIQFVPEGARRRTKKAKQDRPTCLDEARDWECVVDYKDSPYVFPVHICVTAQRPDILIWSDSLRSVIMIELTCPMEENIMDARTRKEIRYKDLIDQIRDQDPKWSVVLKTVEVGAKGLVSLSVSRCLRALGIKQTTQIIRDLSEVVARCSFTIHGARAVSQWNKRKLLVMEKKKVVTEKDGKENVVK